MTELAKEVRLAASYGELSETLQQRIEVVMRFFLALGEGVDTPAEEEPRMKVPPAVPEAPEARVNDDVSIFGMGPRERLRPDGQGLVGKPLRALVDVLFAP